MSLLHTIVKLILTVQFFIVMYGFSLRISHVGRVCSGDFLEATDLKDGHLTEMGQFWRYLLFIWVGMFAIYFAVLYLTIKLSRK